MGSSADLLVDGLRLLEVLLGLIQLGSLPTDVAQVTQALRLSLAVPKLSVYLQGLLVLLLRLVQLAALPVHDPEVAKGIGLPLLVLCGLEEPQGLLEAGLGL